MVEETEILENDADPPPEGRSAAGRQIRDILTKNED
jgi:hypothetical protein